jgi:DNA-binding response OmpR family regulator
MSRPHLKDSSILVVEDEPLIVMDISMAFESAGAHLTTTNTVNHAKLLVEHDGLSAAILDHALPDGDCTSLCTRLTERGVPFLMYSGYATSTDDACKDAPRLKKPASHEQLLNAMEALIRDHKVSPERWAQWTTERPSKLLS